IKTGIGHFLPNASRVTSAILFNFFSIFIVFFLIFYHNEIVILNPNITNPSSYINLYHIN
ncbi:MAG: hypothetical protein ACFFAO_12830, partial [Candidatus Hermodarchaeota archaeon]